MATPHSGATDAAREGARQDNGRFGEQAKPETFLDGGLAASPGDTPGQPPVDAPALSQEQAARLVSDLYFDVRDAFNVSSTYRVHPDLVAIREEMRHGPLAGDYDNLATPAYLADVEHRLVAFRERLSAARDQETETGPPAPGAPRYGRFDNTMTINVTNLVRDCRANLAAREGADQWVDPEMFSPDGDKAVRDAMDRIAAIIRNPSTTQDEVLGALSDAIDEIAPGHPEVHDTEAESALVASLSPLMRARGFRALTRNDVQ